MSSFAIWIATGAYVGFVPLAPGTAGSAAALLFVALLQKAGPSATIEVGIVLGLALAGIWAGGVAERHFNRRDPRAVVIDEVVGMLMTVALVPLTWGTAVAGFFLFRLADIIKPYPANRLERLPGGWGIMADDMMAAVYANVALRALLAGMPGWLT